MDSSPTSERPNNLNHSAGPAGAPTSPGDADSGAPTAAPPPPLTPMAWLTNNAIYLLLMLAGIVWLYRNFGVDGLWRALLVVFGIGFLIFIHELGHFLTAKWCDVHVQTFSVGFGPALPGCSFQRGETLYKIGIIPLGGYVNMVGEGTDVEENDTYPRSFKNKTVLQRMLIISAGVIMNVIFGAIAFIIVFRTHGVDRPPAKVWQVEPASAAWKVGVRTDTTITHIGSISHPFFDDLKYEVALSRENQKISFTFQPRNGKPWTVDIEPRKDRNDQYPVIGVAAPNRLKLIGPEARKAHELPVFYSSPAAAARVFHLKPGDVVVKATDLSKDDKVTALPAAPEDMPELCRRMEGLRQKPLVVEVRHPDGKTEQIEVAPAGFEFGDSIVATTDPDTPNQPFQIKALPPDPDRNEETDDRKHSCDAFVFRDRLLQLAGKPMVMQVIRDKDKTSTPVNILVPPAFHYSLGVYMKIGEVAGVRNDSPAEKAGMIPSSDTARGDELKKIVMEVNGQSVDIPMEDPTRLSFELAKTARMQKDRSKPIKVIVTVLRPNHDNHKALDDKTLEMVWDPSWDFQFEAPVNPSAPLSIPQLGIAYSVQTTVNEVKNDSPAAKAGIQKDDVFEKMSFREGGPLISDVKWSKFYDLWSRRGPNGTQVYDRWPHFFYGLQRGDFHEVRAQIRRGDKLLDQPEMTATLDTSWPLVERGLILRGDLQLQKADTMMQALTFGLDRTASFIKQMYLNLASLVRGRISADTIGGPIELASQTFAAADDPYILLLWLGMISLNLAVVNFLPIPVLDGGHMVFLIYEGLRGRRPSETVQAVATYAGLAVILSLMVFVFYLDIKRRILGM